MPAFPKLLTSMDYGSPTLNATAGSLINVLDACLKDGYGTRPLGGITQSSGVATANVGSGHGLLPGQVILISGANESAYNGEFKLLSTGFNTVLFAINPAAPASATGTLQFKLPPLGWDKVFSGTNLAVYRTTAVLNTVGAYLRVDDNPTALGWGNKVAQVMGYEFMSDVNTGLGRFPLASQATLNWSKSDNSVTNSGIRHWCIFGDDRFFYFWVAPSYSASPTALGTLHGFGDIDAPVGTLDAFGAVIQGNTVDATALGTVNNGGCLSYSQTSVKAGCWMPRAAVGVGSPAQATSYAPPISNYSGGAASMLVSFPNPTDNGVMLVPTLCLSSNTSMRGWLPALYMCPQILQTGSAQTAPFQSFQVLDGMRNMLGKKLLFLGTGGASYTQTIGCGVFLDILSPFRNYN